MKQRKVNIKFFEDLVQKYAPGGAAKVANKIGFSKSVLHGLRHGRAPKEQIQWQICENLKMAQDFLFPMEDK